MRALLLLPVSIALFSASPAASQEAPRVLFCSGPCFAVDANGVRTPAPKGTTLRPSQRFETGAGAYAQLKLGADAAIGVGDSARVRFEQIPGGTLVNLDDGRLRMIRESFGKPTRPIELNTADGRFVLRDADVEIKKSPMTSVGANVTAVKVNAGEALLRSPQGDLSVGKGSVQGIMGGKVLPNPISRTEIALVPPPTRANLPKEPVTLVRLPDLAAAPALHNARVPETVLDARYKTSGIQPPVTKIDVMLQAPTVSTDGISTLNRTLGDLATVSPTLAGTGTTVDTKIIISDSTLSTTTLSSPLLITQQTTVTSPTSITVTETAPTLISPTSTTTATLTNTTTVTTTNLTTITPTTTTTTTTLTQPITSPTIITQPIVLQPIIRN